MPVIPRTWTVVDVPPVYSGYWTAEDWAKVTRTVSEPLVIEALGARWVAVGRNDAGALVYSRVDGR